MRRISTRHRAFSSAGDLAKTERAPRNRAGFTVKDVPEGRRLLESVRGKS